MLRYVHRDPNKSFNGLMLPHVSMDITFSIRPVVKNGDKLFVVMACEIDLS